MYAGEVNVSQEQLPAFLRTADRLKVKGLAETPAPIKREGWYWENSEGDYGGGDGWAMHIDDNNEDEATA